MRWLVAATMVSIGAPPGCAEGVRPTPFVMQVSPSLAFNDNPFSLLITGGPFRPAYELDTSSSRATINEQTYTGFLRPLPDEPDDGLVRVPMPPITWLSRTTLTVELPANIIVGVYDVVLTHATGATSTLPQGFVSLGPDTTLPSVFIETPRKDDLVGAGSEVALSFQASDGIGQIVSLTWSAEWAEGQIAAGSCAVGAREPSNTDPLSCQAKFTAPRPPGQSDVIFITAKATDGGGNVGQAREPYLLVRAPVVSSVSPRLGPSTRPTSVTIVGANFFSGANASPGTLVLFGNVAATLALPIDSSELRALAPPGAPGFVPITVRNGGAVTSAGVFEYVGGPIVRAIDPPSGPVGGGTWVTIVGNHFREGTTQILFGGVYLDCFIYKSAQRIEGLVPPAASPGPVAVTAIDAVGNAGPTLQQAYTYEPTDGATPGGDGGCPANFGP